MNIQALRGVAALMVLAAHIWGADKNYGGAPFLPAQMQMGVTGVDLFFLISGFVMVHVAERMGAGKRHAIRFLYNRGARIYPLYWIATLTMIVFYWGKLKFFGEATQTGGLVRSLALLPQPSDPILGVGWTLVHEIYFYVVFFLVLLAAPKRKLALLAVWGLIVAISNLTGWVSANAWTMIAFSPLTFEFLTGAGIAILVKKLPNAHLSRSALPALLFGFAVIMILAVFFDPREWDAIRNHGARALTFTAPFALMLYGAAALELTRELKAPRWLIASGDASYSLYLFHVPFILVIGKLISTIIGDRGLIDNFAIVLVCAGAPLTAAFVIHRLIEKPALALTRRLGDRLFQAQSAVPQQERIW